MGFMYTKDKGGGVVVKDGSRHGRHPLAHLMFACSVYFQRLRLLVQFLLVKKKFSTER